MSENQVAVDTHQDVDNDELGNAICQAWQKGQREADGYLVSVPGDDAPRRYIGMSSAGKCRRQVVLGRREDYEPKKLTAVQLDTFRVGHLLERDTRAILERGGVQVAADQMGVWWWGNGPGEGVYGHIDGLVYWSPMTKDDGTREIVTTEYPVSMAAVSLFEHKKMSDFGFVKLTGRKGRSWNRDPDMDNVVMIGDGALLLRQGTVQRIEDGYYQQTQCYLSALRARGVPVSRTVFVTRNVEAKAIAVEVIDYSEPDAAAALDRLGSCLVDYEAGVIPARDYNLGKDWQCDYCDYRPACEDLPAERTESALLELELPR